MSKVAVIGMGYVGQGMLKIFPDAVQYDEPKGIGTREDVNKCDLAIICVPTNSLPSGQCDTSIVEDVVKWIETPLILIKSAVEPGTTDRLKFVYDKRIVTSPEFMGEGKYWTPAKYPDPQNPVTHGFIIFGGDPKDCSDIADIFVPIVGPATRFRFVSAKDAEVIKYMENTWGATKVIFANTMRDICDAVGANWHQVREGWVDDPRVEPMHTAVFPKKRGFGGKCYPKDVKALVYVAEKNGYIPELLRTVLAANDEFLSRN